MSQKKQQWGSRLGVILAVAGSAVGLGNFLRFPGNAAENGGGAFMIPYFCALIFLGIPIGWAEWTMGRYGGRKGFHSAPAIMGVWGKGAWGRYPGVVGVLIPLTVYFYYVLIESWCLGYAWYYLTGSGVGLNSTQAVAEQVQRSSSFFQNFVGQAGNGVLFGLDHSAALLFWLATVALNVYFVYRGLSGGIEIVVKWAMPAMAVCGIGVLIRVLTLGTPDPNLPEQSVAAGLGFMWNPQFDKLTDFGAWLAAAGQIFFSLSVGFGVIINYASYMKKKDDVVLSGLTASATNEFFEVCLGGLITLTAAVAFLGVGLTSQNTGSSFSLGFSVLPVVFAHMKFGDLVGFTWFFMLFLAAITSSLSMLQPAQAFFEEALGWTRGQATALVTGVALMGNLFVMYYSKGLIALDTIDFWVGSFMIFILAAVQIICFGWVFGVDKGLEEAHRGGHMRIPTVYRYIIKYVAPIYLIVVFVGFCYQRIPGYVRTIMSGSETGQIAQMTWGLILAVIALLVGTTMVGVKRWRALGLDVDGRVELGDNDDPRAAAR
jgi:SNF family Na+-dependent transporter